jgi:hypothetical protein
LTPFAALVVQPSSNPILIITKQKAPPFQSRFGMMALFA